MSYYDGDGETPDDKKAVPKELVVDYEDELRFVHTKREDKVGRPLLYLGLELELDFQGAVEEEYRDDDWCDEDEDERNDVDYDRVRPGYYDVKTMGEKEWFVARGYPDVSIEFPFHPLTFGAYQHPRTKKDIGSFLKRLTGMGVGAFDGARAGQHIHISREALLGDGAYRVLDFVYRNKQFHKAVSERTEQQIKTWCEFDDIYRKERGESLNTYLKRKAEGDYSGGAVSVRDRTLELRLPRGTTRLDRLYKNIEWAH